MKIERLFPICVFITAFISSLPFAVEAEENGILGIWRPVELGSDSLKQIQFLDNQGKVELRLWPSVNGGEMAPEPTTLLTDIQTSKAANAAPGHSPFAAYHQLSFVNTSYDISLTQKSLRVTVTKEFTDDSGRGTRNSELFFVRGGYRGVTKAAAKVDLIESGWLGIWKNRDRSTQGIAQLTIRDLDPVTMNVYGILGSEISEAPVATVILPISGEDAVEADASGRLKATLELEWAEVTYKLRLHSDGITLENETDYEDRDRTDQEHEYEFVRGPWN